MGLTQFKGSEATERFIRFMDRVFDILNSRNPLGQGFKSPIRKANEHVWWPFLQEFSHYIMQLRTTTGKCLHSHPKQTGFIGLYITIQSIRGVYDGLCNVDMPTLQYLLTYKFSQDLIELLFNAIRARGGWCLNPTPMYFSNSYCRLLTHHQVKAVNGNVQAMDKKEILCLVRSKVERFRDTIPCDDSLNVGLARRYGLDDSVENSKDNDELEKEHMIVPDLFTLSEFSNNAVALMSGYVVKMVMKRLQCVDCIAALTENNLDSSTSLLILQKSHGELIFPSRSVFRICAECEKLFRKAMYFSDNVPPREEEFGHVY